MFYLAYNSKSKNATNNDKILEIQKQFMPDVESVDVIGLDYKAFLKKLKKDDEVILIGGDGTLNHFINEVDTSNLPCRFYFYSNGTGNDFLNDVENTEDKPDYRGLVYLNDLVKNLPIVKVNGKEYKFINGVGYGIDGYCCEKGDELQAKSDKAISYSSIAIKGLLFHYKRPNAKVTVDGVTKEYKRVYLAPTMKGHYYGGGMIIAPNQDRKNPEGKLTNVVMYKGNRIRILTIFPKIFKGEHVKYKKYVDIREGKNFKVEFDKPTALQIDGETISGVTSYEVYLK